LTHLAWPKSASGIVVQALLVWDPKTSNQSLRQLFTKFVSWFRGTFSLCMDGKQSDQKLAELKQRRQILLAIRNHLISYMTTKTPGLKEVWHKIFYFRIFLWKISVPRAPEYSIGAVSNFAQKICGDILAVSCSLVSTTPVINPCHGFSVIAGVIDTGDKLSPMTITPVNRVCGMFIDTVFCGSSSSHGGILVLVLVTEKPFFYVYKNTNT
jgi:hypothetical protein